MFLILALFSSRFMAFPATSLMLMELMLPHDLDRNIKDLSGKEKFLIPFLPLLLLLLQGNVFYYACCGMLLALLVILNIPMTKRKLMLTFKQNSD